MFSPDTTAKTYGKYFLNTISKPRNLQLIRDALDRFLKHDPMPTAICCRDYRQPDILDIDGPVMPLTEGPSHAAWDTTLIRENMVLTLEPSLRYADGRLLVHQEDIVVRSNGAQLLSGRAASELPVL